MTRLAAGCSMKELMKMWDLGLCQEYLYKCPSAYTSECICIILKVIIDVNIF